MSDLVQEYKFFTIEECDEIKKYCYKKEEELIKEGYTNTVSDAFSKSITTTNYFRYNFFRDHPIYADRLVDFLTQTQENLHWPILVQSWVNVYRRGYGIGWHNHKGNMGQSLTANIFIDGPTQPGTTYLTVEGQEILEMSKENQRGYMHVVPCAVYHKVNVVDTERLSIGITIHGFDYLNEDIMNTFAFNKKNANNSIYDFTTSHLILRKD